VIASRFAAGARLAIDAAVAGSAGELGDPALLAMLFGRHMQVGDVQHAQRLGVRCQDWYVEASQGEQVALDERGVGERGRTGYGGAGGHAEHRTHAHAARLPATVQAN
jgi:hypothetical protein